MKNTVTPMAHGARNRMTHLRLRLRTRARPRAGAGRAVAGSAVWLGRVAVTEPTSLTECLGVVDLLVQRGQAGAEVGHRPGLPGHAEVGHDLEVLVADGAGGVGLQV